jgi:hypothetical protein
MKVGLILECGPQGADKMVCQHLVKMLNPKIELKYTFLTNKKGLIEDCAGAASLLLSGGCDRVLIVWDLHPGWREDGEKPCRKEDREQILEKLNDEGIGDSKIFLVCIEQELEAWLLADERAICEVLSTAAHPVDYIKREKKPERLQNPKKILSGYFYEAKGFPYSDLTHAKQIVERIPDFKRLRKCKTFARFALKVADIKL